MFEIPLRKYLSAIASALFLILSGVSGGCMHKDLDMLEPARPGSKTRIVFDWCNAPEADPASMELCLYPEGSENHLSFNLSGKTGGYIELQPGRYGAIAMNNDDLDWAIYRNTNDADDFEVFTHDASELGAYRQLAAFIPVRALSGAERLAATPEMSWSTRLDNIVISEKNGENVITLTPEETVCHYRVEVHNVENILSARGETVNGTLSGMAEGYRHGSRIATDTPVTMPFLMHIDYDRNILEGSFLTFGECHSLHTPHELTIYLFLSDGTQWYYTFDVDDQVANAPDPRNVLIRVEDLQLPKPLTGGGMLPDVNDWDTEHVYVKM